MSFMYRAADLLRRQMSSRHASPWMNGTNSVRPPLAQCEHERLSSEHPERVERYPTSELVSHARSLHTRAPGAARRFERGGNRSGWSSVFRTPL